MNYALTTVIIYGISFALAMFGIALIIWARSGRK